jgi:D-glycero-D-manno-heptose 1,7-bisphosphate phosphatase
MNHRSAALFLDRDGVINKNFGYVSKIQDFEFFPEIFDICLSAQRKGLPIVVITNQSGIGRGFFTEKDFQLLSEWMIDEFRERKIEISLILHAPENPESPPATLYSSRRKPSPAMFYEAASNIGLNLTNSIMIGDTENDMLAAQRAGLNHRILIDSNSKNSTATIIVAEHKSCLEAVNNLLLESKEQISR